MKPVRIGVLGGSFDPPHLGHLALATVALQTLGLAELRWLPARAPWQKADRDMASPAQRAEMVRMISAGEPRFTIDPRELHREGLTYTIDTVRELCAERPEVEWVLVVGQDQYGRFDTWRDWRELLQRVTLAVAARAGEPPRPSALVAAEPHRMQPLELPRIDVSASEIRARRARGAEIASLVGEPVARYIDQQALYLGPPRS